MKIDDLMTHEVVSCMRSTPLSEVAHLMWEHDCGSIPVIDESTDTVCGVVTDRDACMAAYLQGKPLSWLSAECAMAKEVYSCHQNDDVSIAHRAMREHRVHRLPVVDDSGKLVGLIALNDLAIHAKERHDDKELRQVAVTLGELSTHRPLAQA